MVRLEERRNLDAVGLADPKQGLPLPYEVGDALGFRRRLGPAPGGEGGRREGEAGEYQEEPYPHDLSEAQGFG